MLENKNKIVVIGVGNLLPGDEGAGIHAVNEIKKSSTTSQTRRVKPLWNILTQIITRIKKM